MTGRFENKVVLVTGGSRGLGRAMCTGFAAEGARVIVASRKLDACQAVVSDIEADGGQALAVAAHMGSIEDLMGMIPGMGKMMKNVEREELLNSN